MTFEELGILTYKKGGISYHTCPQCSHLRKPSNKNKLSLTVCDEEGNKWLKCHNCGWAMDLDAVKKYSRVKEVANLPKEQTKMYSSYVDAWAKSKGLDTQILTHAGVYEKGSGILAFPIYRNRILVNVKFRQTRQGQQPKFWQLKKEDNAIRTWGNYDNAFSKEITLIEGESDWLTLILYNNMDSKGLLFFPDGAPSPNTKNIEEKLSYLDDQQMLINFSQAERIYLATDNDEAGETLKRLLIERLTKKGIQRHLFREFVYPSGYKDVNEVYNGNKEKKLMPLRIKGIDRLYQTARPLMLDGILKEDEIKEGLDHIRQNGLTPGQGCGVEAMDSMFTLKRGHSIYATGFPGMGKTTFVYDYLVKFCKHNNERFALYVPEDENGSRTYAKLIQLYIGGNIDKISDNDYEVGKKWVTEHFVFISPTSKNWVMFGDKKELRYDSIETILGYVEYINKTIGVFGYVIDTWDKCHFADKGFKDYDYVQPYLSKLHWFDKENHVMGIIIAHATKSKQLKSGNFVKPSASDIKGSGWFSEGIIILSIHRNKYVPVLDRTGFPVKDIWGNNTYKEDNNCPMEVVVEKLKFEELGSGGMIKLVMNKSEGGRLEVMDDVNKKRKALKQSTAFEQETKGSDIEMPYLMDFEPNIELDNAPF